MFSIFLSKMVNLCFINNCPNKNKTTKSPGVKLHRFPLKNEDLLKEWLSRCSIPYPQNAGQLKSRRICSTHFRLEDYADDEKLLEGALPSLNLLRNIFIDNIVIFSC